MHSPEFEAELAAAMAEEVMRAGEDVLFEVAFEIQPLIVLIGQLQLALRHPGNKGPGAAATQQLVDMFIDELMRRGFPACASIAALGNDPKYDTEAPRNAN